MMRFRLRTLLLFVSIVCILAAVIMVPVSRIARSRAAARAAEQLCLKYGGSFSRDLVDGYYTLDLSNAEIGNAQLKRLCELCDDLPIGALDYTNEVRIFLAGTNIDDSGIRSLCLLRGKIVALDLGELEISDASIDEIVKCAPNLTYFSLARTTISDAAIPRLLSLTSLSYLDLSHTNVTPSALRKIMQLPFLSHLNVTGIVTAESELPLESGLVLSCEIVWK